MDGPGHKGQPAGGDEVCVSTVVFEVKATVVGALESAVFVGVELVSVAIGSIVVIEANEVAGIADVVLVVVV